MEPKSTNVHETNKQQHVVPNMFRIIFEQKRNDQDKRFPPKLSGQSNPTVILFLSTFHQQKLIRPCFSADVHLFLKDTCSLYTASHLFRRACILPFGGVLYHIFHNGCEIIMNPLLHYLNNNHVVAISSSHYLNNNHFVSTSSPHYLDNNHVVFIISNYHYLHSSSS